MLPPKLPILKSTYVYFKLCCEKFLAKSAIFGRDEVFLKLYSISRCIFIFLSFQSFLKCLYFQNINHINPLSSFFEQLIRAGSTKNNTWTWFLRSSNISLRSVINFTTPNKPARITYWFHYPKPKILSRDFLVFPMGFSLLRTTHIPRKGFTHLTLGFNLITKAGLFACSNG